MNPASSSNTRTQEPNSPDQPAVTIFDELTDILHRVTDVLRPRTSQMTSDVARNELTVVLVLLRVARQHLGIAGRVEQQHALSNARSRTRSHPGPLTTATGDISQQQLTTALIQARDQEMRISVSPVPTSRSSSHSGSTRPEPCQSRNPPSQNPIRSHQYLRERGRPRPAFPYADPTDGSNPLSLEGAATPSPHNAWDRGPPRV